VGTQLICFNFTIYNQNCCRQMNFPSSECSKCKISCIVLGHMSDKRINVKVCHSRRPIVSYARSVGVGGLSCWMITNSPEISSMTDSSFWSSQKHVTAEQKWLNICRVATSYYYCSVTAAMLYTLSGLIITWQMRPDAGKSRQALTANSSLMVFKIEDYFDTSRPSIRT